jgi:hypothetical protein
MNPEMAMEPLRLHYTEALLRRAVRAFWWAETGWSFVVPMALITAWFATLVWRGDRAWWVGALGALLGFCVLISATVYVTHYRAAFRRLRRMRVPQATVELGPERVRLASDVAVTEVEWRAFTGVRRFPDFWLLYLSRAEFITLPLADLPDEARSFILAKVEDRTR